MPIFNSVYGGGGGAGGTENGIFGFYANAATSSGGYSDIGARIMYL